MNNPWEEISLEDYENHMKLDSVRQLQAMNKIMKEQFEAYPIKTAMVFGVAGGNGLDSIHHQMKESELAIAMREIGYKEILRVEEKLPNGKALIRMDFCIGSEGD